ncbi:hypothetical protein DICPUDRAFT_149698 [Dictyostelium purpureum]|uniref:Fcf2 pre-rRNA processing C-terminal domain-containing protein n=1 Tax=Dictyostelium purpureum TaxID=5786 RepID=F0ZEF8_DICPU|nr:uncharacterized protein DICPUDRAFT_149698 [Dictyostelium purpureum]EGC37687.1 hypothetical protein DICPUDRAFT_149698 [Dictyostelium purpureum]|eukprot:XP_003285791.1 hypothetical protein DICPUDRAFT_149698 [Dictyostelium purpureum]
MSVKTKKIDQNYDVINLNGVSLSGGTITKPTATNTDKKNELLEEEFLLIDQLAKNAAVHLNKLVNQKQIIKENSELSETKKILKKEFKDSIPSKLELLKKNMKPVKENASVLETKQKKKVNHENKKRWYGFGEGEITDEMKQEANLIKLQQFIDPTRRFNRDAVKDLPEHFEIGTFENSHVDYFNRFTNKEKKRGALGDILNNERALKYIDDKTEKIKSDTRQSKKIRKY